MMWFKVIAVTSHKTALFLWKNTWFKHDQTSSMVTFSLSVTQSPSSSVSLLHAHSNMIYVIWGHVSRKDSQALGQCRCVATFCPLPWGFTEQDSAVWVLEEWTRSWKTWSQLWHILTIWKWVKPLISLHPNMLLYKLEGNYACLPHRIVMRIKWDNVSEHASKTTLHAHTRYKKIWNQIL